MARDDIPAVLTLFINPLFEAGFTTPRNIENVEKFIDTVKDNLMKYSDEVLSAAAKTIIEEAKTRTFPMMAICLEACRRHDGYRTAALNVQAKGARQLSQKELHAKVFSEASQAKAREAFARCDYAKHAVEEGWAWALFVFLMGGRHEFVDGVEIEYYVDDHRLPNRNEAIDIRAHSRALKGETETILRGEFGKTPQGRMLCEMWNMRQRKLAALISMEVPAHVLF